MAFHSVKIFINDFIEIYKKHPALWNIKSDLSKNKYLRSKGIEDIIDIYIKKRVLELTKDL